MFLFWRYFNMKFIENFKKMEKRWKKVEWWKNLIEYWIFFVLKKEFIDILVVKNIIFEMKNYLGRFIIIEGREEMFSELKKLFNLKYRKKIENWKIIE